MDKRIQDVLVLLDGDWRRNHRIEELAQLVNLRPSRLQHLFKAAVQKTIRDFVLARRLEEAARLVRSTYERISTIAYSVGFRDVPNFNHAFRRCFGMSPRQYRAVHEGRPAGRPVAAPTKLLQEEPSQTTPHQVNALAAPLQRNEIEMHTHDAKQTS